MPRLLRAATTKVAGLDQLKLESHDGIFRYISLQRFVTLEVFVGILRFEAASMKPMAGSVNQMTEAWAYEGRTTRPLAASILLASSITSRGFTASSSTFKITAQGLHDPLPSRPMKLHG